MNLMTSILRLLLVGFGGDLLISLIEQEVRAAGIDNTAALILAVLRSSWLFILVLLLGEVGIELKNYFNESLNNRDK